MKRNYFVCCLLALLGSLNVQAVSFVVDGISYEAEKDTNLVAVIAGAELYEGAINIPATVRYGDVDYTVTKIGEKAFYYCTGVTSVTIAEGITKIDYAAFRNCSGMTSVTLPSTLKSLGTSAFFGCKSLTSVSIPAAVDSIDRKSVV